MYFCFSFRYDRTFAKRYIHNITVLYFDMIDFCVKNTNSFLLVFIFSKLQYSTVLQNFSFRFIIAVCANSSNDNSSRSRNRIRTTFLLPNDNYYFFSRLFFVCNHDLPILMKVQYGCRSDLKTLEACTRLTGDYDSISSTTHSKKSNIIPLDTIFRFRRGHDRHHNALTPVIPLD